MLKLTKSYSPLKKAFSIAEAMITLLIVSIILAATAPLLSKKAATSVSSENIPSGAVMFFYLNSCPGGWRDVPSDWQNQFFRVQQGSNRQVGSFQDFAIQNLAGSGWITGVSESATAGGVFSLGAGGKAGANMSSKARSYSTRQIDFNLANSAKTDYETRPSNIALLACIKN